MSAEEKQFLIRSLVVHSLHREMNKAQNKTKCLQKKERKKSLNQQELTEDSLALSVFSILSSAYREMLLSVSIGKWSVFSSLILLLQTVVKTHFTDTLKTLQMRGVIQR